MGATAHRQQQRDRPGRRDPGAHRRQRRRRRHRRGRPPRDVEAGVLRPRPGRHRRPGRRADPGHEGPRHPADRRLRPRRVAEVQLVRRLPALARLPDAGRPLPAGAARPRRVRDRGDRHRRRRGGVRPDARAATCSARWWSSDGGARHRPGRPRRLLRHVLASTARPTRSTTTSGWSATTTSAWSSTRRTAVDDILGRRGGPQGQGDPAAPTPTTTTSASRPRCARRSSRRSCCTPTTGRCGS